MDQNIEIPEDVDKMLFAEDIVRYMMARSNRKYSCKYEQYRDRVYNAFNEPVQRAFQHLTNKAKVHTLQSPIFKMKTRQFTIAIFKTFTKDLVKSYFPEGFDVNNLLKFCVDLITISVYFCILGVTEAPSVTVQCIYDVLQEYDTASGGWDTLNSIAKELNSVAEECVSKLSEDSDAQNAAKNECSIEDEMTSWIFVNTNAKVSRPSPSSEKEQTKVLEELDMFNPDVLNVGGSNSLISDEVSEDPDAQNAARKECSSEDEMTSWICVEANENASSALKIPSSKKEPTKVLKELDMVNPDVLNVRASNSLVSNKASEDPDAQIGAKNECSIEDEMTSWIFVNTNEIVSSPLKGQSLEKEQTDVLKKLDKLDLESKNISEGS